MRLFRRGVITVIESVPPPTEREVLRALGIPHHQKIEDVDESGVREAILLALRRALELTAFKAVFRTAEVVRVSTEEVHVVDGPGGMLRAPTFAKRFAHAKEIAIIAVTLGQTWDDVLDELGRRGEAAEAWFLDALGTHFVDQASRHVEQRIARDLARVGLGRIGRYRAGYGDVPLERQALFCDFLDARRIGIETTEAMSLWPRKSVTTVVGFREGEDEDES
jgi:hypothetical protein